MGTLKNGMSSEIGTIAKMIDMNKGIFVKTMFGFKESRAKLSHELKMHVRGATSAKLTPFLSIC